MRSKLRSHALLLLLVAAGLVFAGQGVSLFLGAKALSKAKLQLAAKERQLTSLANSAPAPTQAAANSLDRELIELRGTIARAESLWRDNPITRTHFGASIPPNHRAAYFDLVRYRQALADLARVQGVEIGQDEFFGFRAYANEGPEEADILSVHTQRLVLERVLESLLRSRPQRLLAVIRQEGNASADGFGGPKFEPAHVGYRFHIRFLGTTAVLRGWLNELASDHLPVLVRAVTVETGGEHQIAPARGRQNAVFQSSPLAEAGVEDGFELLARPSGSEFFVTLDYVELWPDKEVVALSDEASRVSNVSYERGGTWPEPEPQARGPQWVFDVFTPPEIFYHSEREEFLVKAAFPSSEFAVAANSLTESQAGHRNTPRLLKVQREDYPLQLSGYIGGGEHGSFGNEADGAFFGLFENRESGETLFLRGGDRVAELGIEVLDFRLESRPFSDDADSTLREPRAVATIRDALGEWRILYEGERAEGHVLVAQIEWGGEFLELRKGDVLAREDGESLSVEEIQVTPQSRVVMRSAAVETEPLVLVDKPSPADSTH